MALMVPPKSKAQVKGLWSPVNDGCDTSPKSQFHLLSKTLKIDDKSNVISSH